MHHLTGKVALVTGTARKRGIGCAIALRLAQDGADVAVTDRPRAVEQLDPWDREEGWRGNDSLVEEIKALGRRALSIDVDLTNRQKITDMVAKVLKEFGKIDILVNNAAMVSGDISGPGGAPSSDADLPHVVSTGDEIWDRAVAVNFTAPFLICKAVIPQMIKRGQGGKIINISSGAGKQGMAGRGWYSATKAGMQGLTQALADEVGQYNINVNCVCPAGVASWGSRGASIWAAMKQGLSEEEAVMKVYKDRWGARINPLRRPGTSKEVASVVAFLASSDSDYVTGQSLNVNGGLLRTH